MLLQPESPGEQHEAGCNNIFGTDLSSLLVQVVYGIHHQIVQGDLCVGVRFESWQSGCFGHVSSLESYRISARGSISLPSLSHCLTSHANIPFSQRKQTNPRFAAGIFIGRLRLQLPNLGFRAVLPAWRFPKGYQSHNNGTSPVPSGAG